MPDFLKTKKTILFVVFVWMILLSPSVRTAVFSTDFNREPVTPEQEKTILEKDLASALEKLDSDTTHEMISAIRFFDNNLTDLVSKGLFKKEHMALIFEQMPSDSFNLRSRALMFIDSHIKRLFKKNFLSREIVDGYHEGQKKSGENQIIFLGLIHALLTNNMTSADKITPKDLTTVVESFKNGPIGSELAASILTKYKEALVEVKLLTTDHISRFASLIKDVPPTNHANYLKVFKNNAAFWLDKSLMSRQDAQTILSLFPAFSPDLQDDLHLFLDDTENLEPLLKANVFNHDWFASIRADFENHNHKTMQDAYVKLAFFLTPFIENSAISQSEFNALWQQTEKNQRLLDAPYLLIGLNFKALDQKNWFTQTHYNRLFDSIAKKPAPLQKEFLLFAGPLMDWLENKGWLDLEKLNTYLLTSSSKDTDLEIQKLRFIDHHEQVLFHNDSFNTDRLKEFLSKLYGPDDRIFEQTLKIVDKGFTKWYQKKTLSRHEVNDLYNNINTSTFKTAEFLGLVNKNYQSTAELYNKKMMGTYCELIKSADQRLSREALSLFKDNIDLIKKKTPLPHSCRVILSEKGILKYRGKK
ncbi:MAG: hypothetical protein HQM16_08665 [Deltaproteobacteria bacterium]|nr:hypothetical protein [Deltaproteobacteria bacterium]